jgi:hypothetical protein
VLQLQQQRPVAAVVAVPSAVPLQQQLLQQLLLQQLLLLERWLQQLCSRWHASLAATPTHPTPACCCQSCRAWRCWWGPQLLLLLAHSSRQQQQLLLLSQGLGLSLLLSLGLLLRLVLLQQHLHHQLV